jgi:hypothetical protein
MDIICKRLGVHTKVIGNPLRLTTEKWQELNIPGPNGSPAQFSDDIWLKCQKSAIRAVNTGEAFFNDAKKAAYNELISVVPIS